MLAIANKVQQEERWLAQDVKPWEEPGELLNTVDDYVLDGFIDAFQSTFSAQQTSAVIHFRDELEKFCIVTSWEPAEVLADPQWAEVRHRAADFVQALVTVGQPQRK